ncbi:pilin [Patescibacteria group bacterium AH-259-L07]|nr:pilin [Patescibacteria group bacterium AH-259-L07]
MTKKVLLLLIIAVIGFAFVAMPVLALGHKEPIKFQPQVEIPGSKFKPGEEIVITKEGTSFAEYLSAFFDWSIRAIVLIGVVMIMVGGFQWMTAAGNAPKVGQAKARIISALIGIGLALGSYSILNFISPSLTRLEGIKLGEPLGRKELLAGLSESPCGKCGSNEICVYEVVEIRGTIRGECKGGRLITNALQCGFVHETANIRTVGNKCSIGEQCSIEASKTKLLPTTDYKEAKCLKAETVAGQSCTAERKDENGAVIETIEGICIDAGTEARYKEYKEGKVSGYVCAPGGCGAGWDICCRNLGLQDLYDTVSGSISYPEASTPIEDYPDNRRVKKVSLEVKSYLPKSEGGVYRYYDTGSGYTTYTKDKDRYSLDPKNAISRSNIDVTKGVQGLLRVIIQDKGPDVDDTCCIGTKGYRFKDNTFTGGEARCKEEDEDLGLFSLFKENNKSQLSIDVNVLKCLQ